MLLLVTVVTCFCIIQNINILFISDCFCISDCWSHCLQCMWWAHTKTTHFVFILAIKKDITFKKLSIKCWCQISFTRVFLMYMMLMNVVFSQWIKSAGHSKWLSPCLMRIYVISEKQRKLNSHGRFMVVSVECKM